MIFRLVLLIVLLGLLIGAGLATSAAQAAQDFTIFGEMYSRWDGFRNKDADNNLDDDYSLTLMRTRIGCRAWIGSQAVWMATLENARVLGSENASDEITVHEAHFDLRDVFVSGFDASIGRHSLAFGNERLIGRQDWALDHDGQYRFDGLLGSYDFDNGSIDLLWLKLHESGADWRTPSVTDDYFSQSPWFQKGDVDLRGIYGRRDLGENCFIEPYVLTTRTVNYGNFSCRQSPVIIDVNIGNPDRDTADFFGALIDFDNDNGLHVYGEVIVSRGDLHSPGIDSLSTVGEYLVDGVETVESSATAFYCGLEYTIGTRIQPWIGFEYNYASGDDSGDKDETFHGLFGSFSDYLGASDIVGWSNTSSYCFRGGFTARDNLSISFDYWYFRLSSDTDTAYAGDNSTLAGTLTEDNNYDRHVGHEFDLFIDYDYAENIGILAGIGVFSQGDYFGPQNNDAIVCGWLGARLNFGP